MKYSSYTTRLLKRKQGSIWQARLKYKDPITNQWKETSKMLPEAKGKREANKMALEWFNEMNEAALQTKSFILKNQKTENNLLISFRT